VAGSRRSAVRSQRSGVRDQESEVRSRRCFGFRITDFEFVFEWGCLGASVRRLSAITNRAKSCVKKSRLTVVFTVRRLRLRPLWPRPGAPPSAGNPKHEIRNKLKPKKLQLKLSTACDHQVLSSFHSERACRLAKSLGRPMQIPVSSDVKMKKFFAKRVPNLAKWQGTRRSIVSSFHFISRVSFHFTATRNSREMKCNAMKCTRFGVGETMKR